MTQQEKFDPYNTTEVRPIYATQGGGYAVEDGGNLLWLADIPHGLSAKIGDSIPDEWGVAFIRCGRWETGMDAAECDEPVTDHSKECNCTEWARAAAATEPGSMVIL